MTQSGAFPRARVSTPAPMLGAESLYVGVDVGKQRHVAGFVSSTLLSRHQRFEHCPAVAFDNGRGGFRQLIERIRTFAPLAQAYVALEVTGHYQHALVQYLQELDLPVFILHPQTRQSGLLKTDKRDALGLANLLYAQLEKGVQLGDPLHAVRRLVAPTPAAERLRGMVRHRYELVNETTQRKNKLTAICDELFPEFTQICRDPNLPSAVAIRRRFPTPAALVAASVEDLCATRVGTRPSDERLADLRLLAAVSIGVRSEDRVQGLVFEQEQLLDELALLTQHLERLESEMTLVVGQCREGQILTSIPGIGAVPAAAIIASIGNIANFARSSQLKSYFGWAPTLSQSGRSAGAARLSPRGSRLMKRTMYLAAWKAIQVEDSEWKRLYEKLIPLKCRYDERLGRRVGRGKVLGRIAGQMTGVIFALLKRDELAQRRSDRGRPLPAPTLYDADLHRQHRSGLYLTSPTLQRQATLVELPHR